MRVLNVTINTLEMVMNKTQTKQHEHFTERQMMRSVFAMATIETKNLNYLKNVKVCFAKCYISSFIEYYPLQNARYHTFYRSLDITLFTV